MKNGLSRRLLWLLLPALVLLLDWASKAWILKRLQPQESLTIIPGFFNFTLGFNTGAIFGSFQSAPIWLRYGLFTLAGLMALGYFGYEFLKTETLTPQRLALGLILGGALGNGLDRILYGAVVDFVDFYALNWNLGFTRIHEWHYWAFNLADSCILSGAVLFGITMLRAGMRRSEPAGKRGRA
jgi:signal peptidase II